MVAEKDDSVKRVLDAPATPDLKAAFDEHFLKSVSELTALREWAYARAYHNSD